MNTGIRPIDVAVVGEDLLWATETMNELARNLPDQHVRDFSTVLEAVAATESAHPTVVVAGPGETDATLGVLARLRIDRPAIACVFVLGDTTTDQAHECRKASGVAPVADGDPAALARRVHRTLIEQQAIANASRAANATTARRADRPARDADQATPIIAVTAGKGGVGATIVAINLARALLEVGVGRVSVVEARCGLGDISILLDLPTPQDHNVASADIDGATILRLASFHESGLTIIHAPPRGVASLPVHDLLARLVALDAHADLIVLDVPIETLVEADILPFITSVLIVTTPQTPSLKDALIAAEELGRDTSVELVVNHAIGDLPSASPTDIERATGLRVAAALPYDSHLARAVSETPPRGLAELRSRFEKSLEELARQLVERVAHQPSRT